MFKKFLLAVTLLVVVSVSLQAKDNIEVYNAYGNAHHVVIQGRMLRKRAFEVVKSDDSWVRNLWRRAKQIESNEISNAHIIANIHNEKFTVKGDDEGYFEFNITLKSRLKTGYEKVDLTIENNTYTYHTLATIIEDQKLVGIISDFDDTLIVSNVTDKFDLAINTVLKNYQQRILVTTMQEQFRQILSQNPKEVPSTLFILSGSPQQLFTPVEGFLNFHHFPKHTLILKKAHGDNKDPLSDQFAYKTQKIERLMKLYPSMTWVMFGDSGEKDRDVYGAMYKKYPYQIKAFYIRDIENGKIKQYK